MEWKEAWYVTGEVTDFLHSQGHTLTDSEQEKITHIINGRHNMVFDEHNSEWHKPGEQRPEDPVPGRWYWDETLEVPMQALYPVEEGSNTWRVRRPNMKSYGNPAALVEDVLPSDAFRIRLGDQ